MPAPATIAPNKAAAVRFFMLFMILMDLAGRLTVTGNGSVFLADAQCAVAPPLIRLTASPARCSLARRTVGDRRPVRRTRRLRRGARNVRPVAQTRPGRSAPSFQRPPHGKRSLRRRPSRRRERGRFGRSAPSWHGGRVSLHQCRPPERRTRRSPPPIGPRHASACRRTTEARQRCAGELSRPRRARASPDLRTR